MTVKELSSNASRLLKVCWLLKNARITATLQAREGRGGRGGREGRGGGEGGEGRGGGGGGGEGGRGGEGRGGRLWHLFQNRHTYKYSLAIGCINGTCTAQTHIIPVPCLHV